MPMFAEELAVFRRYLKAGGLKQTRQREAVLESFLRSEKHLSVEELYRRVRKDEPAVSQPTVFRTLKLLCRAGLARTLYLEDKTVRYEHGYRHAHHDHLVCENCGRIIEVADDRLAALKDDLCRKNDFQPRYYRLKVFGACAACRSPKKVAGRGSG